MAAHVLEDPNVIYVFVDQEDNTVSLADITDWLTLVDEVESVKVQYDATSKQNCYYVRFKRTAAAQLVTERLNGQRLKNCTVRIVSRVYCTVPLTSPHDYDAPGHTDSEPVKAKAAATVELTSELPHNHLVPPDLHMDTALARMLPRLDTLQHPSAVELIESLRNLQRQLCETLDRCAASERQAQMADAALKEKLYLTTETPAPLASGSSKQFQAEPAKVVYFTNTVGVHCNARDPAALVSSISELCGPVSFCCCQLNVHTQEYRIHLAFMMLEDAARFKFLFLHERDGPPQNKKAREEMYHKKADSIDEYNWVESEIFFPPAVTSVNMATYNAVLGMLCD